MLHTHMECKTLHTIDNKKFNMNFYLYAFFFLDDFFGVFSELKMSFMYFHKEHAKH